MQYHPYPIGVRQNEAPVAPPAEAKTSRQLVGDHEPDAGFFRALEKHGIALNRPQIEAVRHDTGPALTLAGAGSGKTSMLVCRTAYLLTVRQAQPQHILLMTFSKKAADEMQSRIRSLPVLDARASSGVEARTFHSFCLQLLRGRGYRQSILGETGQKHVFFKRLTRELMLQHDYEPETLLARLSALKLRMAEIEKLPETTTEEKELKLLFTRYEQWKKDTGKLDYDDLLLEAYRLLRDDAGLLSSLQRRFQYIMIDEFQDTNQVQYVLVQMLADRHRNLMVVGDDDQTIYSFNGARNDYILNFEHQYPGAATIVLDINYRSTASIVGLGNAIIQPNKQRKPKTLLAVKPKGIQPFYSRLKSTQEEAQLVADTILAQTGEGRRGFGDFAVLYRTASSGRALVELLLTKELPFHDYGDGQLFYDQWAIKPLLAHLRLALDRRNFDAMESLLPTLYVNREQAMAFIWHQDKQRAKKWPLIHLLEYPQLKDFQKDKLKERIKLIKSLTECKPADAIRQLRLSFYDQYLETGKRTEMTEYKEGLKEMLDELQAAAGAYDTIEAFVAYVDEITEKHAALRLRNHGDGRGVIKLMSIHRSKGLEFPVVFVIGASEGILPHSSVLAADKHGDRSSLQAGSDASADALEEERRLVYVAVTRAKEELYVSSPALYRGKPAELSRFIRSAFGADEQEQGGDAETALAWLCTGDSCQVWQRIVSYEESQLAERTCPLCGRPMKQGAKVLPKRKQAAGRIQPK
ncbi:UvrD-helicase domain-containing protein [Paenibacillus arenilitoris]|uniref:DNA 3'-5' helicase n=1 Tax=Paenibacillus arenilitoris TaxID=2772299 RepID=A0A927H5M3_9BACL|nr:UvrD-helicase domain-containing protein [Paenibacillus arenilitoris]MBD2867709.1 UvrD-helicase domain-containing protein [Paenibacillus arenilitoris]